MGVAAIDNYDFQRELNRKGYDELSNVVHAHQKGLLDDRQASSALETLEGVLNGLGENELINLILGFRAQIAISSKLIKIYRKADDMYISTWDASKLTFTLMAIKDNIKMTDKVVDLSAHLDWVAKYKAIDKKLETDFLLREFLQV